MSAGPIPAGGGMARVTGVLEEILFGQRSAG
jgi:hypothetical protein